MSDDFLPYCAEVKALAQKAGLRVELDPGGRSLSKQIKVVLVVVAVVIVVVVVVVVVIPQAALSPSRSRWPALTLAPSP